MVFAKSGRSLCCHAREAHVALTLPCNQTAALRLALSVGSRIGESRA